MSRNRSPLSLSSSDLGVTPVVIVGTGQIGTPLAAHLASLGHPVVATSRHAPGSLPDGVRHVVCDGADADALEGVIRDLGARAVVVAANPSTYAADVWRASLLPLHRGVIEACRRTGARVVALENLYMHGPEPLLSPETRVAPVSRKGEVRAEITRMLEAAAREGVRVVRLRAPDFYGRGLPAALLGDESIAKAERGELVVLPGDPDAPHAFAHRDDVVEALARLALEPDVGDDEARVYVAPSIHASPRALLAELARERGTGKSRIRVLGVPVPVIRFFGLFVPLMRELAEMAYQWAAPYRVDDGAFRHRFGVLPRTVGPTGSGAQAVLPP